MWCVRLVPHVCWRAHHMALCLSHVACRCECVSLGCTQISRSCIPSGAWDRFLAAEGMSFGADQQAIPPSARLVLKFRKFRPFFWDGRPWLRLKTNSNRQDAATGTLEIFFSGAPGGIPAQMKRYHLPLPDTHDNGGSAGGEVAAKSKLKRLQGGRSARSVARAVPHLLLAPSAVVSRPGREVAISSIEH